MDTKTLERVQKILDAQMSGNIDPELADRIRIWFMGDAHRDEKYAVLKELWEKHVTENKHANPKLDADFAAIAKLLGFPEVEYEVFAAVAKQQPEKRQSRILPLRRRVLLKIAAVCLPVAILVGGFFVWFDEPAIERLATVTVSVPAGGEQALTLSDSTQVKVSEGSTLRHAEILSGERVVELDGEAYFNVSKAEGERGRFTARTPHLNISVLGTGFKVCSFNAADYSTIELHHGSIEVEAGGRKLIMSPREHLRYEHHSRELTVKTIALGEMVYEHMPGLVFFDSPLADVFHRLESEYGVRFRMEGKLKDGQAGIRGDFSEVKSIGELMGMLQKLSGQFTYRIGDDEISIESI